MNSKLECIKELNELKELFRKIELQYIDISLMQRFINYNALYRCELLNKKIDKLSQICNNIKE